MTDDTRKARRGAGRVAFLARRAEFESLIAEGHALRTIHAAHKDHLGISYAQFTRYVARYMSATGSPPPAKPPTAAPHQARHRGPKARPGPFRRREAFVHDPDPKDRTDLI